MIFLSELFVKVCVDEDSMNFNIYYIEPQDSEMDDKTKNSGSATAVDGWIKWGIIIY